MSRLKFVIYILLLNNFIIKYSYSNENTLEQLSDEINYVKTESENSTFIKDEINITHLPSEILINIFVLSNNHKIHHISKYFFEFITNFNINDINKKGLSFNNYNFSSLNFSHRSLDHNNCKELLNFIPTYFLGSMVAELIDFPIYKISLFKCTCVKTLNFKKLYLSKEDMIELHQLLEQMTNIKNVIIGSAIFEMDIIKLKTLINVAGITRNVKDLYTNQDKLCFCHFNTQKRRYSCVETFCDLAQTLKKTKVRHWSLPAKIFDQQGRQALSNVCNPIDICFHESSSNIYYDGPSA